MATQDTIPLTFQAYHRLDASRVRRAWQRSSPHEMAQGALLTQTGMQLIERLEEIRLVPERILDLGDRTGQMGRQLQKRWPKAHIVSLTFAEKLAQNSRYRAFPWQRRPWNMVGEATHLPFGRDTFDLVLSNMALHWTTNLPNTLQEIRRVLAPDRLLLFTVAGEETLWELHTCLAQLDQEQYGHIKKRGQELPSLETLGDLLLSCGLVLPVVDRDQMTLPFPDLPWLLHLLKTLGAGNHLHNRAKGLMGKTYFKALQSLYETRFRQPDQPLTFTLELISGHAWKAAAQSSDETVSPG